MMEDEEEFFQLQRKFSEIISDLPGYGPVLARIKAEYESAMQIITDTQRARSLVQLREKHNSTKMDTLRNLINRKSQLEAKVVELKGENKRLINRLDMIKAQHIGAYQDRERKKATKFVVPKLTSSQRKALQLSIDDVMDLDVLEKEFEKTCKELQEIKYNTEKRHIPMAKKMNLHNQLAHLEQIKQKLEIENSFFCHLHFQLSQASKVASQYYSRLRTDPSCSESIVDAIFESISSYNSEDILNDVENLTKEDSDEEKEAEFILQCSERFNQLFDNEQYEEAALLAASSPKGVLRTMATLAKFKSVSKQLSDSSPLLHYSIALMDTGNVCNSVTMEEAMECVSCVLSCDKADLIGRWIGQETLPLSHEMGMLLLEGCKCGANTSCQCLCSQLALVVFQKLNCPYEVGVCLAKLGQYYTLSEYIKQHSFSYQDLISLLHLHPCQELSLAILSVNNPHMNIVEVLLVLMDLDKPLVCEQVLEEYILAANNNTSQLINTINKCSEEKKDALIQMLSHYSNLEWLTSVIQRVLLKALSTLNNECFVSTSSYSMDSEDMSGAMLAPSRGMLAKQDWIDFEDSEPPSDSTASDITLDHNIAGYYGDNSDNEGEEEREGSSTEHYTDTGSDTSM